MSISTVKVLIKDSSIHSGEHVVKMLMTVFGYNFFKAKDAMIKIHELGGFVAEITTKERAELLVEKVNQYYNKLNIGYGECDSTPIPTQII